MKLLPAAAVGALAAISLPFLMRHEGGLAGTIAHYGTVHPTAGTFSFPFSLPIFLAVTLFAWALMGWANR